MPITAEGADLEIVRKVNDIIEQYEAAARQLRELSRKPQVDGITGYHEFPSLAEEYENRAQKYREVARLLREPPKTPLSPNQEDWVKECVSGAANACLVMKGWEQVGKLECSENRRSHTHGSTLLCHASC
eukprot:g26929.t1